MKLLDTIFEALLDGHVLVLQHDSYAALKNEEGVIFSNKLLVFSSEQPDEHPNEAMLRENLAYHILAKGENMQLISKFLSNSSGREGNEDLAEVLLNEEPELAALVSSESDLELMGAQVAAGLVRSGTSLGQFTQEPREDIFFNEDVFVYERKNSDAPRPELRLAFQSEVEIGNFLTKAGWIRSQNGMLYFRGNLARHIRSWLEHNEGLQSLREFARRESAR